MPGNRPANIPEDNPALRHREVIKDRYLGSARATRLAGLRYSAIAAAQAMGPQHESNRKPATAGVSYWVELGPTAIPDGAGPGVIVTGRVTEVVQHPTDPLTLYVAAARGGVWKTTDGGVTWTPKSDHEASLAIGALAISNSNPQILYAGTGEGDIYYYRKELPLDSLNASYDGVGVLKSCDGGHSWTLQGYDIFEGACFFKLVVHPASAEVAFAASNLGLYRTLDGGAVWAKLDRDLPSIQNDVIACCDIVVHPTNPDIAYCAFWADGIYKTENATAQDPSWKKLIHKALPESQRTTRIALAISPTSPGNLFALIADSNQQFEGFYESLNGGASWSYFRAAQEITDELFGAFTLHVAVHPLEPNIVYLSGICLYKATRNGPGWEVVCSGDRTHDDHHTLAFHPTDRNTIYAGTDGGIYKSTDGGRSWSSDINEGLGITQFEFIGQHPTSDATVIGGTQDNGTEMFRNHPAFYHSDDGDGGAAAMDPDCPQNMLHVVLYKDIKHSTCGGHYSSWFPIAQGLCGDPLFYPPFALCERDPKLIAFGTTQVCLDDNQGRNQWTTKITLPGIDDSKEERVSAIYFPKSDAIYIGTTSGNVYVCRSDGPSGKWVAVRVRGQALPPLWIWDIASPDDGENSIILVMSGFGGAHVWRGTRDERSGAFQWTDVSGSQPNRVPDIPVNALCIDPKDPRRWYVGTDIGVFRTVDAGSHWTQFSNGLPDTSVYDLRLHQEARVLRAATHGRGLWERKLDVDALPAVDLYVRDHLMSTSRILPTPAPVTAPYAVPHHRVSLNDDLWWWQCLDIKVGAQIEEVDYLGFETRLKHCNPRRKSRSRLHVQIHNRGLSDAHCVTAKVLYAEASPTPPDIPPDFWTAFPGDGDTRAWKPVGAPKVMRRLSPKRPEVLYWDWTPAAPDPRHCCLLILIDSPDDPIPSDSKKIFDIATLVTTEKRVGLKNLHVVNCDKKPFRFQLRVTGGLGEPDELTLGPLPEGWRFELTFPKELVGLLHLQGMRRENSRFVLVNPQEGAFIRRLPPTAGGFLVSLDFRAEPHAKAGSLTIVQKREAKVVGGITFALVRGNDST